MPSKFEEIAENVFCFETELRLAAGFYLNARMTVIRRGKDLWIHSPLPATEDWYDEVSSLGEVRVLVAPNLHHHLYMSDAADRFPAASVVAPAALRGKRPDLRITADLDGDLGEPPPGWPEDVSAIAVDGAPGMSEYLFYDAASESLLVTDLLFNNERPRTWLTRTFVRITSGWKGPARSLIWRFLVKDKAAFSASLEPLSDFSIERVIPCHGRIIEDTDLAVSLIQTGRPAA